MKTVERIKYKILVRGTMVSCNEKIHHLYSLEHRPDTEYRCCCRTNPSDRWQPTPELARKDAIRVFPNYKGAKTKTVISKGLARQGAAWQCVARLGLARLGKARQGRARQGTFTLNRRIP